MKHIIYNFNISILLLLFLLSSCSDDLGMKSPGELENSVVTLNITIEDATIIKTKTNQNDVEKALSQDCNHYALVYNLDALNKPDKLIYREDISGIHSENSVVINLGSSLATDLSKLHIVVLANISKNSDPIKTLGLETSSYIDLLGCLTSELQANGSPTSPFVMSGVGEKETTGNTFNVSLQRSAAKVSIETSASNFILKGYKMYNAPCQGFYTAGVALNNYNEANKENYIYKSGVQTLTGLAEGSGLWYNYTYPVMSLGNHTSTSAEGAGAYFIVEGEFEGENCFYRVDLIKNGASDYYNINPNHWYEVNIKEVLRKGYPSKEEAEKRFMGQEDTELLVLEIHDHAAPVYSMITDGIRELGVTKTIIMDPSHNTMYLTVKCYSQISSENEDGNNKPTVTKKNNSTWLSIDGGRKLNSSEYELSGEENDDNPGTQWKFELTTDGPYSNEKEILVVTWQGLSREVTVNYNALFNVKELCSVDLFMDDEQIPDYWRYLEEDVFGIKREALADGKVRDEGFHFPMPYGYDLDNPTEYTYIVKFDGPQLSNKEFLLNVKAEVLDGTDPYLRNLEWTYKPTDKSGTLKLSENVNKKSYEYAIGKIKFTLEFQDYYGNDLDPYSFSVDIYHTGFFHSELGTIGGHYYYEVVSMGKYHWLDRNVGAKSNKMYVEYSTSDYAGHDEAKGLYYSVATPGINYENPVINDGTVSKPLCPPGYHIPNTTEWDNIRLSPNFMTENITDGSQYYMTTYYLSEDPKVGKVYFPKPRYYYKENNFGTTYFEGDANMGDDAAGYYWTRNPSSGLEKDEIGQWLRVLNICGHSNTYINGSIKNNKMSLRCVAGTSPKDETNHAINFNVKGATHVYLYTVDDEGNKSGVFAFPGKAIGTQKAVDGLSYGDNNSDLDDSYLHFSYTSSVDASKLYVFFTYVTESGKITILSRNNSNTLSEAVGWPVKVGYNYYFTSKGSNNLDARGIFKTGFDENDEPLPYYQAGKKLTVKWWEHPEGLFNYTFSRIYVWFPDSSKPAGIWPGTSGELNSGQYTLTIEIPQDSESFMMILNQGNSYGKTEDIEIGNTDGTDYNLSKDSSGNVTVTINKYYKLK